MLLAGTRPGQQHENQQQRFKKDSYPRLPEKPQSPFPPKTLKGMAHTDLPSTA
jgi:hypothetical protein